MSTASQLSVRVLASRWTKYLGVPLLALACQNDLDHPPPVNGSDAGAPDDTPGVVAGPGAGPSSGTAQGGNSSVSGGGVVSGVFTGGSTGLGGTLGTGGTIGAGNAAGFGVTTGGTVNSFGFGGNPITPGTSGGFP